jgi:hypothetical protein
VGLGLEFLAQGGSGHDGASRSDFNTWTCFCVLQYPPGRLYLGPYLDTGINGRRDGCIIWASQLGEVLLLEFNLAEGLGQGTGGEGLHC